MRSGSWAAGLLAAALSVACVEGAGLPPTIAPPQPTATPAAAPAALTLAPNTPLAATPTTAPADASAAVEVAIATLARELGLPEASIGLEEVLPVQWNDSSLGCPAPGEAYLQVITPGYLITLAAGEETYSVHTDLGGTAVVCADEEEAIGEETPRDPVAAEFTLQARDDLAVRLGIPADEILLVSAEAIEWPDTSLGCPQEGMDYAQVVVPGYLIVLVAGSQTYEYHTDYQQIFLCESVGND
jgi:hypothetical protein